jgi:hypothetical protein
VFLGQRPRPASWKRSNCTETDSEVDLVTWPSWLSPSRCGRAMSPPKSGISLEPFVSMIRLVMGPAGKAESALLDAHCALGTSVRGDYHFEYRREMHSGGDHLCTILHVTRPLRHPHVNNVTRNHADFRFVFGISLFWLDGLIDIVGLRTLSPGPFQTPCRPRWPFANQRRETGER